MRILTKGITEISRDGDKLVLTYSKEEEIKKAMYEIYLENRDWMDNPF